MYFDVSTLSVALLSCITVLVVTLAVRLIRQRASESSQARRTYDRTLPSPHRPIVSREDLRKAAERYHLRVVSIEETPICVEVVVAGDSGLSKELFHDNVESLRYDVEDRRVIGTRYVIKVAEPPYR